MKAMINIGCSNTLTAFDESAVGSKVTNKMAFLDVLAQAIVDTDFSKCRQPGQAYIKLPECKGFVSSGVGKRSLDPRDYFAREHRGKIGLYLRRHRAAEVDNVAAAVYTKRAYLIDPDVTEEEADNVELMGFTHIIVAVLASTEVASPLTPGRFVHNLAGGNNEALLWSADEIRNKAKDIINYSKEWCVVADETYTPSTSFTF